MTTDQQSELLTQVDEHNNVIGGVARGVAHNTQGIYYRTIFVLVKNSKNEFLLQKRSTTKDLYPDCWDLSVGGHVAYGDSYETTAARELGEELGIVVSENDLVYKGEVLVALPVSNEYFHVFEYNLKDSDVIRAAGDEVAETKWMIMAEIKQSITDKSLAWYPRPTQVIEALY